MIARRTATRIKNGSVQKKNNWAKTPNYWGTRQDEIQIDIAKPGKGYRHFIKKREIKTFLEILPNRDEIDVEFDAVLLASGRDNLDGWYRNGVIAICAWEKEMEQSCTIEHFEAHKDIFIRLGVEYELKKDYAVLHFNENQIKAYQLLHIFLHELGHHHDRINTKSKRRCSRGENYAESYAFKYEEIIWNKYFEYFQL